MVAPSERGKNWYQAAKLDFGRSTLKRWGWLGESLVQGGDGRVVAGGETILGAQRLIGHGLSGLLQGLAIACGQAGVRGFGPTGQQLGTGIECVVHVVHHTHLDAGVVQPGDVRVFPTFDGHGPFAELTLDGRVAILPRLQIAVLAALDHHGPTIEAGIYAGHGPAHGFLAARVAHDGGGTHLGTAFDEHLGGHLKRFAEFHTGGEDAALLGGSDVHDIDAAELAGLVCFDGRCGGFDSQAFQRCCGACRFGADSLALGCGALSGRSRL